MIISSQTWCLSVRVVGGLMRNHLTAVTAFLMILAFWGSLSQLRGDELNLIFCISTDKEVYEENEPVVITLTLINQSDEQITLVFHNYPYVGYQIYNDYVYPEMVNPVVTYLDMEPYEEKSWEYTHLPEWYFLYAGTYSILGFIVGYGSDYTTITVVSTSVDDVALGEPDKDRIVLRNFPNPFNPETNITFRLSESGRVTLYVYNIKGETVRKLSDSILAEGVHNIIWDGKDDRGNLLPSGVYTYRLTVNEGTFQGKMLLMK